MITIDEGAVEQMWAEYKKAHPDRHHDTESPPAEYFGDSPEMADELLEAVISGPKRATAALVAEFADGDEELPRIGSHWVACDGRGQPRLVMRSLELRIGPVSSVDDAFAYDEGEGERTREWWIDAHRGFWQRSCARMGLEYDDSMEAVFERFAVVWPPEYADE